jgi:hypothetical protein
MTTAYANGPQAEFLQLGVTDPASVYYNNTAELFGWPARVQDTFFSYLVTNA